MVEQQHLKKKICAVLVRNAVIFDVDNTSSSHNFLILGKGTTNVIFDSVGAAGKKLVLIFVKEIKEFA